MSQLSSFILVTNANPSFGPGRMAPPYAPLSFVGGHIPQTNPTVGGWPPLSSRPNTSFNAPRWSSQPGRQVTSYIPSFTPFSSMLIPKNTFIMGNPPLSSGVPSGVSQFHAMGNPYPGASSTRGNVYDPHYVVFAGMLPIQPFMNQFGGGYYPTG
jgi:hypothetical protein